MAEIQLSPRFPKVDTDGYTKFQLWDFMQIYGKYMILGAPEVIKPLDVYIEDEDLSESEE